MKQFMSSYGQKVKTDGNRCRDVNNIWIKNARDFNIIYDQSNQLKELISHPRRS
ncbi:hypothetical protein AGMMS49587_20450 [Spirochaetia bacterium]|nr:hypothetical protein AGMMS49587_20450 [Spirochaetia bacterium]